MDVQMSSSTASGSNNDNGMAIYLNNLSLNNVGDVGDVYILPIRTLRVEPIRNAEMEDPIKSYFNQFGTVNSVKFEQDDDSHAQYSMVEFKSAETAAAVLSSNEMHRICGVNVQIKAAELCRQPDHILNALDDHCLRMIFSLLNQTDLLNAANTCVRFNQEAKSVFSTKIKHLKLDIFNDTTEKATNALETFGSMAQSIDVTGHHNIEFPILSMIDRWCTSELTLKKSELKELTLRNFVLKRASLGDVNFDSVLRKLEKLTLDHCFMHNEWMNVLSCFPELKSIEILSSGFSDDNFEMPKFDKLEELHLKHNKLSSERLLNGFVKSKSKLKKLFIVSFSANHSAISATTSIISEHFSNLLELELTEFTCNTRILEESIGRLVHLTSLKVLKLHFSSTSTAPLAAVLQSIAMPINHLKLSFGKIDSDTIKAISKMKQLKVLELSHIDGLTDENIIELANGLGSQLEKLQLEGSTAQNITTIGLKKMLLIATKLSFLAVESRTITIDADDYKTMLEAAKKRPETLMLELTGRKGQVEVDKKELIENRRIFCIKYW